MTELLPIASGRRSEAAKRYACLASAIAGRAISVHFHDDQKQVGYADWQCIHLPLTASERSRQQLVIAQGLLLRAGGIDRRLLLKMVGRPGVAQRFLHIEIVRAVYQHTHIVPRSFCEQSWIVDFPLVTANPEESYRLAAGGRRLPAPPEDIGVLRVSQFLGVAMPVDARAMVAQKGGDLHVSNEPRVPDLKEEDAEDSLIMKLLSNPLMKGQGGMLQSLLKQVFGTGAAGKPSADGSEGGGEMPIGRVVQMAKKGLFARLMNIAGLPALEHEGVEPATNSYAEWDTFHGRYRPDWALVEELDPWRDEPNAEIMQALRPPSQALVRRLSGIGLDYQLHNNEEDGLELIVDRVVDYAVDVRTRRTPNLRLYRASRRTKRDLAVLILLDISGSTAESGIGGSIHQQQSELAYQLAVAFDRLGDQVALFGYHSWGRKLVRFLRLKSFRDPVDASLAERFKYLDPVGYTRTGAALRHAAHKLRTETRLPHRLLIVISDGFAYDQDYEGVYAEDDTRKALEEIRAAGSACLCLSIGSDLEEEQLRAVFGAATTLSVRNGNEFLGQVRQVILRALLAARPPRKRLAPRQEHPARAA